MSVVIDGTLGITSPAETVQGALTTTGNTILGDASTDTLNVGNGGLVKDASGNVGIGTSTPGNKLTALSTSTTATLAKFGAANYGNLGTTYIEIGTEYVDGGSRIGNINPAGNFGTLVFETMTGVSGVFAEGMRIDSSGNLLVGTTSATAKLTIKGSGTSGATKAFWTSNSAGSELLYVRDDGALYSGAGASSPYNVTTAAAANMVVAADRFIYRSTSALKYKQNIRDLPSIDINKFRPVVYNSKCNGDNQAQDYFGLIADEVDAAGVKELVTYGIDGEVESFQYERLTVVLLKAIQEQQALITQLQADVATLKALSA